MKHRAIFHAPGVSTFVPRFVDQDGNTPIDALGQLRVAPGAENGAGARIGIEEGDVLRTEGNMPALCLEVIADVNKQNVISLVGLTAASTKNEYTELERPMNIGENRRFILKIVQ